MKEWEIEEVDDLLLDVLNQACGDDEGLGEIDNQCISVYEEASNYLKNKGALIEINSRIYNINPEWMERLYSYKEA